ncbi:MAG: hypothetical protein JSV97_10545 [candidate division WOR-3 bacterium]|nr:MAG: hypothetical protein JSV97_10545 [candidate division WOR-3 bacterium]
MKPGDLVRLTHRAHRPDHNHGVGLVVRSLTENPFIVNVNNPKDPRWAVLWTNPLYTMNDGTSVQYESELEVIGEAS